MTMTGGYFESIQDLQEARTAQLKTLTKGGTRWAEREPQKGPGAVCLSLSVFLNSTSEFVTREDYTKFKLQRP